MRVIPKGQRCKRQVDHEISMVAQTHHLVGAIYRAKNRAEVARNPEEAKLKSARALQLLERYYYFIVFNAYCRESAKTMLSAKKGASVSSSPSSSSSSSPSSSSSASSGGSSVFLQTFAKWLQDRGELQTILDRHGSVSSEEALKQLAPVELEKASSVVANRKGDVLGPGAILKSDHFPG
jgi:hypothetical protein